MRLVERQRSDRLGAEALEPARLVLRDALHPHAVHRLREPRRHGALPGVPLRPVRWHRDRGPDGGRLDAERQQPHGAGDVRRTRALRRHAGGRWGRQAPGGDQEAPQAARRPPARLREAVAPRRRQEEGAHPSQQARATRRSHGSPEAGGHRSGEDSGTAAISSRTVITPSSSRTIASQATTSPPRNGSSPPALRRSRMLSTT